VIAAFAVDNGLIDKDLYSSVVLAILLSTIIAPFSLRFTISYFNKRALAEVLMVEEEIKRTEEEGDEEMLAVSLYTAGVDIHFYVSSVKAHLLFFAIRLNFSEIDFEGNSNILLY